MRTHHVNFTDFTLLRLSATDGQATKRLILLIIKLFTKPIQR